MLMGRGEECLALDGWLGAVEAGRGGGLVLCGEPGIGKSVLLDYVAASAIRCDVTRVAGIESEMELPYAALHQVCAPTLARLDRLPIPQRAALGVAFGLQAGAAPDRLLVGLAVLSLLGELARERAALIVIDDAQWLDTASAQALAFVAHRVVAEPLGLVFATRTVSAELRGLPTTTVSGLRPENARLLLDSALHTPLDEHVRDRIVAEADGNPLALLELPRTLTPAQLAGGFGLPESTALSGHLEKSFARRAAALPPATRRLLLLAAAEPLGDPVVTWRAAEQLGIDVSAIAETDGLLAIDTRVAFRHPLVRSAVYRSASAAQRREAHRALAAVTDPETDPDRRVWHRAHAAVGPNEEIAQELESSADRARARGGVAAAAAFLERAVALTALPSRRTELALAAATAKHQSGDYDRALELLAVAEAAVPDKLQLAEIDLLRGRTMFSLNRGGEAAALLLSAARQFESLDNGRSQETYLQALASTLLVGRLNTDVGVVEVARAARGVTVDSGRATDLLLDGLALLAERGYPAGVRQLERALAAFQHEDLPSHEGLHWLWLVSHTAGLLWDDACWDVLSRRLLESATDTGVLSALHGALNTRAGSHAFAGDFALSESLAQQAREIAAITGSRVAPYAEVVLAGLRGEEVEALELMDAASRAARRQRVGMGLTAVQWMSAVLYNGLGRYEEAFAAAREAGADHHTQRFRNWALAELVEAATRTGRSRPARTALGELVATTDVCGTAWAAGIAARTRALLAAGAEAERLYCAAITHLEHTRMRTDLARAHLLYGEWLRRARRRLDAREQLRRAHRMFAEFGMVAFAERARIELEATGERARGRAADARIELTAQETQVARLAAEGATNADIAARLFISTSTVDYHLRKVFRKLTVQSRTQLAHHVHQFGLPTASG
ncbi:transcriptional regulator [Kutzneria sp. CA-103260]|nr:transcriptional regulator [Kutzneria sp. CA-103260]